MRRAAVCTNWPAMLSAISRRRGGIVPGTASTQGSSSSSVMAHASGSVSPRSVVVRAFAQSRVPPQSGHTSCRRNFSTRFMPFSSFTFASAFSTVRTALK